MSADAPAPAQAANLGDEVRVTPADTPLLDQDDITNCE
jgi:hypothetical protein